MNPANLVPPVLTQPSSKMGRIGLGLALVAPATIALMVLLQPG
jgi:hypothetical protein